MKTAKDLKKIWLYFQKKYWDDLKIEIQEKPYPESIKQWAKIVDSMRLFVYIDNWKLSSWRLNANCKDDIFNLHIEDLENTIKEKKFWIETTKELELPF
jgi:hypothetical protein